MEKASHKLLFERLSILSKVIPYKLNREEISRIKEMILSENLIHYSVNSLSWLGKKTGQIFGSPTTWAKIIQEYSLRRPNKKALVYSQKHLKNPLTPQLFVDSGVENIIKNVSSHVIL